MPQNLTMNACSCLKEYAQQINIKLELLIPLSKGPHSQLYEAARYSLLGNGKRLRPALTLVTTETLGGNIEDAINPACALEMVHIYSMIHDDLPCMDDDDYRRGEPTLHNVYPEGHAVLTGCYLLTYAFEILATSPRLTSTQKAELITCLAKHSGADGMIGGQVMDLSSVGQELSLETLEQIYLNKTAALITAALEFGAIISNASTATRQLLRQFGQNIGYAFQIIDDVIDVTATEQKHGGKVPSDEKNKKTTYVSLLGVEESQNIAYQLLENSLEQLQQLPGDTSQLAMIAKALVKREI